MTDTVRLDIESMRAAATEATGLLRTLAILQPTLSQQLGVLRKQRLVNTRRAGKKIYHAVKDPKILTVLNQLYALYCGDTNGH